MNTIFMDKSYVVATILESKYKHYKEKYVTFKECNEVERLLIKEYNQKNLNVCITDNIDDYYFKEHGEIILLNNDVELDHIRERFQGFIPLNILLILWNDKLIYEKLENLKNNNENTIYNSTTMDKIIERIVKSPTLFYEKIAGELSIEEYDYINRLIKEKSCVNCDNRGCGVPSSKKPINHCLDWCNPALVGKAKLLRK